jgi:UDP-N-acetylglucosamine 2-epimerase (non-hydrolysing)
VKQLKVGLIFGTRPEAIKMAPLYHKLVERGIDAKVIATAQHREMLDQVLELFGITPDYDLNIMKDRQTLAGLTGRLSAALDDIIREDGFDWLLTQGDTTSTFVGSLISFYNKVPVGHVEAGLRSFEMYDPFPEEMNRCMTSKLATLHFAPTQKSKDNLLRELVDEKRISITGNTVIDALMWVIDNKKTMLEDYLEKYDLKGKKYILMTMHRRENHGEKMKSTMKAVRRLIDENKDYHLVFPVHYNPAVRDVVYPELEGLERVTLIDPVEYLEFVALMNGCQFILSDSGGVQEEAPALGKPVLVLRETTERPEAISSGVAKLIGTDTETVYNHATELIQSDSVYKEMSVASNPFGDGSASDKIVDAILGFEEC